MASIASSDTGVATQKGRSGRQEPSRDRWIAWLWAGPAILFVAVFLVYPVIYTLWLSLFSADSSSFVGLQNFRRIFTSSVLLEVLRNNLLWLVLGTIATVFFGLVIAVLVDRVRFEGVAKAAIFIPMSISFVGASVIWSFMYQYQPAGQEQTGLINAVITKFGFAPQSWLTTPGLANFALIAIYVWMWTGFCMVILSAALKSVPADILEAARVDGANEFAIFFRVTVPMISPTIVVVATTMVINLLKIFDIIYVTTGGNFGTNVIAMSYYQQLFTFNDSGLASALAVILLLAVIPVLYFNIRRFRAEGVR
jgi:alpha-glucoside transport system permease protein